MRSFASGLLSPKRAAPDGEWLPTLVTSGGPRFARSVLHHLQPSLLNHYQRCYFQSADGRFRLTVDSGLQFAAARQAQGMGVTFCSPAAPVVIELKFGLAEAEYAAPVTNALPFRLARCSKYVLGINALAAR